MLAFLRGNKTKKHQSPEHSDSYSDSDESRSSTPEPPAHGPMSPEQQRAVIAGLSPEEQRDFYAYAQKERGAKPAVIDLRGNGEARPMYKKTAHIPTGLRVERIFETLSAFKFDNEKPQHIIYTLTEEDRQIEENIKQLFNNPNPILWTSAKLKKILIKIVDREDILIHPHEREEYEKNEALALNKEETKILELFYPNLVRLMMALISHIHSMKVRIPGTKDATKMTIIQDTWKDVLSQLNDILEVIIYANEKNAESFLDNYPTEWTAVIQLRNRQIAELNESINVVNTKINELEKIILRRDAEMEAIRLQYANQVEELEKSRCEKRNIEDALSSLLDVKIIVKNNLAQLTERFVKHEQAIKRGSETRSHYYPAYDGL